MSETKPGAFPRGKSGNPAGRPRKAASVDALLATAIPAILERVIELAIAGDMTAIAIVLAYSRLGQ